MADPITLIATAVADMIVGALTQIGVTAALSAGTVLAIHAGITAIVSGLIYAGAAMLAAPAIPHPERGHQNFKQSVPRRRRGYGRARIAGYFALYEAKKGKAYLVHAMHHGRIGGVIQHYLNDDEVTLDEDGFVFGIDGKYGAPEGVGLAADKVQIFTRLGVDTETPYSEIATALPEAWTSSHRGDRVASTAMIVKAPKEAYQSEVFPNGLPQHSEEADLACVWDWRDGGQSEADDATWETSRNPFVNLRDLICGSADDGCMGEDYDRRILPSLDYWTAAANDCDASIAKVGGTETKYEIGGFYDFDNHPADIIGEILRSCDGWMSEAGDGSLMVRSGAYYEPTITLTDRVITDYAFQRFLPDQDACNELLITFTDPGQKYTMAECDPWRAEADIDARGVERTDNFELRWVQRHTQARRLAKREMLRRQAPTRGTIKTNLYGLRALGERYVRVQISEIPALNDIVIDVIRADIDLQGGSITFSWIEASPDMDDWDPATEEGAAPGSTTRPDAGVITTPEISDVDVVFVGEVPRLQVTVTAEDRDDLTWKLAWSATSADGPWIEADAVDVDPGASIVLQSGVVPSDTELWVRVQARSAGQVSEWSAVTSTEADTGGLAPSPPTAVLVTPSGADAEVTWSNPASSNFSYSKVWRSFTSTFGDAVDISGNLAAGPGTSGFYTDTPGGGTFYYWVVAYNASGLASAPAGPDSATFSYDADASAVFGAFSVAADDERKNQIDTLVTSLKAAGVWSKLDSLFVFAAHHEQAARVDWKAVSRIATAVSSPTFTADRGFTFNGSSSYLALGFNPSTHGVNLTGTSGTHGVYSRTNATSDGSAYGATSSSTVNVNMFPRTVAGNLQGALGHAASGAQVAIADSLGLSVYERDSTTAELFKNGVSVSNTTPSSPGSTAVNLELFIGCRNGSGAPTAYRPFEAALFFAGGVLTDTEQGDFYDAVQAYMTSVGANV